MSYIDCGYSCGEKHPQPDCCFDWAVPIDWIRDVQRVIPDIYRPLGGHIVWRYGPDDGLCGRPVGLCAESQAIIDAYEARQ